MNKDSIKLPSIEEKLKNMIDYDESYFDFNGEGFLELYKKLERNESYVRYVLFIAYSTLIKNKKLTIKEISYKIQKSEEYVQKITNNFLNQNLLIKIKSHRKNIYVLNMDEDNLKCFMQLFVRAKELSK